VSAIASRILRTIRSARERMGARATGKPLVGYIGAQGGGNLGDDSMYAAAGELLSRRSLVEFGQSREERWLTPFGLGGRRLFESIVLGGGTLINPIWMDQVQDALRRGLRLWSLGTGLGSCGFGQPDDVDVRNWSPLLKQFIGIGVRGFRSKAALEEMGIGNVRVVGDLALALAQPQLPDICDVPRVAVSITQQPGQAYGDGECSCFIGLEQALRGLVRDGWIVDPIAMHPRDAVFLGELMRRVGQGGVPVSVPRFASECFGLIAPCTFMIAVRLHAAVFSCCVGVPPLMLGYREKCLEFMESMNLEAWHVPIRRQAGEEIENAAMTLSSLAPSLRLPVHARALAWKETLTEYVRSVVSASVD